nr:MAG TPA: hypothetical protein [Caudoviricetes sp.]
MYYLGHQIYNMYMHTLISIYHLLKTLFFVYRISGH